MKIISVVGARPNFMKIAPFLRAIEKYNKKSKSKIDHKLVHTGQHYDYRMSKAFFSELGIKDPDINLEVGSGSHAEQTAHTMLAFEKVLLEYSPDWVVVVGDVNATLACSVTARKLNIKVCHIEAGLRSGDLTMPEEINRLVTDRISDLLLTPDHLSSDNLMNEGIAANKIEMVGNIMIDTLDFNIKKALSLSVGDIISKNQHPSFVSRGNIPEDNNYILVTMHRPSNVDGKKTLNEITDFLCHEVARELLIIWPIHPRTFKQLQVFGLSGKLRETRSLIILEPISYREMLRLNYGARMVLTDSGGLQEECCITGTACLTLRWNTERPVTLKKNGGVSMIVGNDINLIRKEYHNALSIGKNPSRPEKWDGKTAGRCLIAIINQK
jgi:UDP-N-acetylglucosamine 2-epimerase (non-hydrolysing)